MVRKAVSMFIAPVLASGLLWSPMIVGSVLPVAAADVFQQMCPDVVAQFASWKQRADDHNNRTGSIDTYDNAAVDAFNAEKAQLEAERTEFMPRLDACDAVVAVVTPKDPSGLQLATPTAAQRLAIDTARKSIPTGYQPQPARAGDREVVPRDAPERPLYDALRDGSPEDVPKDVRLAGTAALRPGAPDPVYPGLKIGETQAGDGKVSPSHIVSLAELIKLPGFLKLTSDQMYILSRLPLNYQWQSWTASTAADSGSAVRLLPQPDASWAGKQMQLKNETSNQLRDVVNNLVRASGG